MGFACCIAVVKVEVFRASLLFTKCTGFQMPPIPDDQAFPRTRARAVPLFYKGQKYRISGVPSRTMTISSGRPTFQ